jgi:hypothetical protein
MTTKIIISRFELIDNPPTGKVVGFTIKNLDNEFSDYTETIMSIAECVDKTDNEICQLAYLKIKLQIENIINKLNTRSTILGSEFVP